MQLSVAKNEISEHQKYCRDFDEAFSIFNEKK